VTRPAGGRRDRPGNEPITISFAVLGVVVLFVWNAVPPEIVAVVAAFVLYATGLLGADQVFAGFGDATVVFIAALFVVSEGLDATGARQAGQQLNVPARSRPSLLLVLNMALFAVLAAVITPTGAVAALVPVAVVIAMRTCHSPSSLLMPLAFVASAGSLLALTGSPVNVMVSEAAAQTGDTGSGISRSSPRASPWWSGAWRSRCC
jgi:Na+/H+ antiporter NhaD/arsenite permease-like protein